MRPAIVMPGFFHLSSSRSTHRKSSETSDQLWFVYNLIEQKKSYRNMHFDFFIWSKNDGKNILTIEKIGPMLLFFKHFFLILKSINPGQFHSILRWSIHNVVRFPWKYRDYFRLGNRFADEKLSFSFIWIWFKNLKHNFK